MRLTSVSVHMTSKGTLVWATSIALGAGVGFTLVMNNSPVTLQTGFQLEEFFAISTFKFTLLKKGIHAHD